jgi:hypothetical protein
MRQAGTENRKTAQLIAAAVAILDEESPMTIRQLFYRLVSKGLIPNDRKHYQLVSSIKEEVKKKHLSLGWKFSCFSAHTIERELF